MSKRNLEEMVELWQTNTTDANVKRLKEDPPPKPFQNPLVSEKGDGENWVANLMSPEGLTKKNGTSQKICPPTSKPLLISSAKVTSSTSQPLPSSEPVSPNLYPLEASNHLKAESFVPSSPELLKAEGLFMVKWLQFSLTVKKSKEVVYITLEGTPSEQRGEIWKCIKVEVT
mmetsp:Transcript_28924/g.35148  ORF Transcript_28924/g.35148 Transcript_28924/m.35148 type:complete len:172 (+) Transcript_28924:826-1341(+)